MLSAETRTFCFIAKKNKTVKMDFTKHFEAKIIQDEIDEKLEKKKQEEAESGKEKHVKEKDSQGKESDSTSRNKHQKYNRDLTQSEELNLAIEESLHTPESEKSDKQLDAPAAKDESSRAHKNESNRPHKGECLYCGIRIDGGQDDMEVHWLTECASYKEF